MYHVQSLRHNNSVFINLNIQGTKFIIINILPQVGRSGELDCIYYQGQFHWMTVKSFSLWKISTRTFKHWGYSRTGVRVNVLMAYSTRNILSILNNPTASSTYKSEIWEGTPDLTLSGFFIINFVTSWKVDELNNSSSDHRYILHEIKKKNNSWLFIQV